MGITFGLCLLLRIHIASIPINISPTIAAATAMPIVAPCDRPDGAAAVVAECVAVSEGVEVVLPGRGVDMGRSVDCQLIWISGAIMSTFWRTATVVEREKVGSVAVTVAGMVT